MLDTKKRTQKCHRKVGFKEVGTRRQAEFVDGKCRNIIMMGILKSEWK